MWRNPLRSHNKKEDQQTAAERYLGRRDGRPRQAAIAGGGLPEAMIGSWGASGRGRVGEVAESPAESKRKRRSTNRYVEVSREGCSTT
jgi:hypothetical protein